MLNITDKDDVHLHTSKTDILKIIGVLLLHFVVTLMFISFIVNFILRESFLAGAIVTVLIASVMLTSAIRITLRWSWNRITVNGKKYQFIGKAYPLFGMVLLIAVMMIVAEAVLGVGLLLLMGPSYVWWQLTIVTLCLVVMVTCLLYVIRYMKKWTSSNIKERAE